VSSPPAFRYVGLGRYGVTIVADRLGRDLANTAFLPIPGCSLILSVPIAEMEQNLVQFNTEGLLAYVRLAEPYGRLLLPCTVTWNFVFDEARTPCHYYGDPPPLLEAFRGFCLCGGERRRG
jgi:hypothetical protein